MSCEVKDTACPTGQPGLQGFTQKGLALVAMSKESRGFLTVRLTSLGTVDTTVTAKMGL